MTELDRILHLVNAAVTALATGGQPALDTVIRDIDDDELEALIAHLANNLGAAVRFHAAEHGRDGRPQ
ncbi:hypothetical protein [Nocardia wallacei]|uniref:hypothetical protein n=1 Tax=Nocardia wallacei TaxID=480035 RepID=UPI0024585E4B|nr:hypothetical protein [Nocardia wallacei]